MIIKYVDPHQNVYWFEDMNHPNTRIYYGKILKIRPGYEENINNWKVGDMMSVCRPVCVIDTEYRL